MVKLYVLYILNMHVQFYANRMLFIIWSINLFLYIVLDYKNLKFKYLIDGIAINFFYFLKILQGWRIKKKMLSNYGFIKTHTQYLFEILYNKLKG